MRTFYLFFARLRVPMKLDIFDEEESKSSKSAAPLEEESPGYPPSETSSSES